MQSIITDYGLRFYIKSSYTTGANKRGGSVFTPLYKKDLKTFKIRTMFLVNRTQQVLNKISVKYPVSLN
jgi:hypothetical protein